MANVADVLNTQACSHCGKCKHACEVLGGPDLDIGQIESSLQQLVVLDAGAQVAALQELMSENYALYNALRQCCFCGHCTASCASHLASPGIMRQWRQLFAAAGFLREEDSKIVMVDNEWHIFSAYRAIYEIGYTDLPSLDAAAENPGLADTLFFPGCSLASYAPALTRKVCAWLTQKGVKWALDINCCGSPLMSAGLFERANNLRQSIANKVQAAGIKRVVTVCAGCAEELAANMPAGVEMVALPSLILELTQTDTTAQEAGFDIMPSVPAQKVTFFDSCHDRQTLANGQGARKLLAKFAPEIAQVECAHHGANSLCCGAGGAVGSYDAEITSKRVWRIINEAQDTGAGAVVTTCPTCTYTIAQALLGAPDVQFENLHYLEILFNEKIDWAAVFGQLGSMWEGQWGPWLYATFYQ